MDATSNRVYEAEAVATILGIPRDRLVLLVGRGVREYDRDHRDPARVEVKTHTPGSRLAREAHRLAFERDAREGNARTVARQYDDAEAIYRVNGDGRRASYCANMAEHIRAGMVITQAPGARTVAPLQAQALATPRARERRDSSSSKSSGQDPGSDDEPPSSTDAPSPPRTPAEIVAERFRVIDEFIEQYGAGPPHRAADR